MKTCSKCKESKDEAEFSKEKSREDGLYTRCRSCVREYRQTDASKEYLKAYRKTDAYKEYQREYQREYQKAFRLRKKAAASNAGQSGDTQTIGAQE